MNEIMQLIVPFLAGLLLGALFFGGLWWTVQKGLVSSRPALWFMGSMLLRTGIVLAGFYFVMGGDWRRLLVCLAGFIAARMLIARMSARGEGCHAP